MLQEGMGMELTAKLQNERNNERNKTLLLVWHTTDDAQKMKHVL